MREVFKYASQGRISLRNDHARLKFLRKTNMGHKSLSYVSPSVLNKLSDSIKRNISLKTFKHDVFITIIIISHYFKVAFMLLLLMLPVLSLLLSLLYVSLILQSPSISSTNNL